MKFTYSYRNGANEQLHGEISAPSRDAVYIKLKAQGIKPCKVDFAPGFLNTLSRLGKLGWAFIALVMALFVVSVALVREKKEAKAVNVQEEDRRQYEQRSQIYGDPAVLNEVEANGWSSVLPSKGDQYLAQYAIPGKEANISAFEDINVETEVGECIKTNCNILADDMTEIAKMKRMVNGIKREARSYVAAGGKLGEYIHRLDERQQEELTILNRFRIELSMVQDEAVYRERNISLRQMGLPMVQMPEDDSGL